MPVVMPTHLTTLAEAKTPEEFKVLVNQLLGPALRKYTVCGTDVLFVTYIEPEKTSGGVYRSQKSLQENLFQGTVGLVVGLGPLAFRYDSKGFRWEGDGAHIGDWIVVRFADCWEIHIDGVSCRLIDPENIRGIVTDPTIITHRPPQIYGQLPYAQPVMQPVMPVGTGVVAASTITEVSNGPIGQMSAWAAAAHKQTVNNG